MLIGHIRSNVIISSNFNFSIALLRILPPKDITIRIAVLAPNPFSCRISNVKNSAKSSKKNNTQTGLFLGQFLYFKFLKNWEIDIKLHFFPKSTVIWDSALKVPFHMFQTFYRKCGHPKNTLSNFLNVVSQITCRSLRHV